MATDSQPDIQLEIGHVLFIDIVGYSKLLITRSGRSTCPSLRGAIVDLIFRGADRA